MTKNFKDFATEDRRLVILRVLKDQESYSLNCSVMQMVLQQFGHGVSRDQVRTDYAWLAEQDLLTVERLSDTVHVAKITARGVDVAKGLATTPGVKRPGPEG
ncbi:ArsR family transcriptional regulator [Marivibrio halodurans]|uniref:ArsR family transcriptional regulator n=1 Tax=Marivibrio halodurans TaxID=2039722 RepID=A0A8J7V2F5_9PROT|nr:ArsR family transcriptional regulator [Marivibrio halodurans]MBP5857280.1 ArsR family transcriptional regulator [Marivibrio halodurans]